MPEPGTPASAEPAGRPLALPAASEVLPPLLPAPPPDSVPWHAPPRPVEHTVAIWQRALVPFVIFAIAFGLYQYHVDQPSIIIFDEAHYVKVARNYTNGIMIDPAWGAKDPRPQNFEHPPLGKYLIAAGIWLNGKPHNDYNVSRVGRAQANQDYITKLCGHDNPECAQDAKGWRLASTVVGASAVVATYFVAMRLFNRVSAGIMASAFLLLDGMFFLHARLALLDIFPVSFAMWAWAFSLAPYRAGRWVGAVFMGFALASKYSILFVMPLFFVLMFIKTPPPKWIEPEEVAPELQGPKHRVSESWIRARPWFLRLGVTVALAVIVPLMTLLVVYGPYFVLWSRMHGPLFAMREWIFVQVAAFTWDYAANATHPYASPAYTWIPMIRPVYYYTFDFPNGLVGKMYSVGNPFLWWTATLGILVSTVTVVARFVKRSARNALRWDFLENLAFYPFPWSRDLSVFFSCLLFYFTYLPWFTLKRILFLFYITFAVPAFAIFAAGMVSEQWDLGGPRRILAILYVFLVAIAFMLFYPIVTGVPITKEQFDWTMRLIPWMTH